jgi:hypothetical protein
MCQTTRARIPRNALGARPSTPARTHPSNTKSQDASPNGTTGGDKRVACEASPVGPAAQLKIGGRDETAGVGTWDWARAIGRPMPVAVASASVSVALSSVPAAHACKPTRLLRLLPVPALHCRSVNLDGDRLKMARRMNSRSELKMLVFFRLYQGPWNSKVKEEKVIKTSETPQAVREERRG